MDNKLIQEYKALLIVIIIIKIIFIFVSIYNLFELQASACNFSKASLEKNCSTSNLPTESTKLCISPRDSITKEIIHNAQVIINNTILARDYNGLYIYKLKPDLDYIDIFCNAPNYRTLSIRKKISQNLSQTNNTNFLQNRDIFKINSKENLSFLNLNVHKIDIFLKPLFAHVKFQFFDKNSKLPIKDTVIEINKKFYKTDGFGCVVLKHVPYGYNRITISSPNFKEISKILYIKNSKINLKVNLDFKNHKRS